jgi:hypothetical protein
MNVDRRSFLTFAGVFGLCSARLISSGHTQFLPPGRSLLTAPIELAGMWPGIPSDAVMRVLLRVRSVCLSGLRLLSDRQPAELRIDGRSSGTPAIWLHDEPRDTAWMLVNVGPADWSKLAYQFGHELGHVLCNSWDRTAMPALPTQWLEETIVEAFSIRGLGLLAQSWALNPPFVGDEKFSVSVREYRHNLVEKYRKEELADGTNDVASWFRVQRDALESGRTAIKGRITLAILSLLEQDRAHVEDLGALNRWPARSKISLENYLPHWQKSCLEINAPARLPASLRSLFRLD